MQLQRGSRPPSASATKKTRPCPVRVPNVPPALRFAAAVAAGMSLFHLLVYRPFATGRWMAFYLHWNARAAVALLRIAGEERVVAAGTSIASPTVSLQVRAGCDALQATAFLAVAVLASPVRVPWRRRIRPIVLGAVALSVLNLVRIVTLYYAARTDAALFTLLHTDVWQGAFIFIPLLLWMRWLLRLPTARPCTEARASDR